MVVIIAVAVGGLISAFCIGIIVYMVFKAVKKRRELMLKERQEIRGDSPGPEDEDIPHKKQLSGKNRH